METKPYAYNRIVSQVPQQQHLPEDKRITAYTSQQQAPVLQNQQPKPAGRMPKAQALALISKFKQWLVVASLVGFGTFSGLAAFHQVNTPAAASQTSSGSSQTTTSATSSSQSSNNFFNQQGGNNFGSSSSSQAPVSGSSVS
jgi:hypothetical protein